MTPATGDDLPIFDEAPDRAIEFEPRALRPPGRRGRFAAAAWALAVACLVGVGALATDGDDDPPGIADAAPSARVQSGPGLPSTRMGALLLHDVVVLVSPAPARVEVTTRRLDVAGAVLVRANRVLIALEARGNRVLESVSMDVSDLHGGIRAEYGPAFSASFDLPFPRPNGTMWVVVTAYDEGGMPLGLTRRPFRVGPLEDPAGGHAGGSSPGEGGPLRPDGESPLAERLPICLPISGTLASQC